MCESGNSVTFRGFSVYDNHDSHKKCIVDIKSEDGPEQVAQKLVNLYR